MPLPQNSDPGQILEKARLWRVFFMAALRHRVCLLPQRRVPQGLPAADLQRFTLRRDFRSQPDGDLSAARAAPIVGFW